MPESRSEVARSAIIPLAESNLLAMRQRLLFQQVVKVEKSLEIKRKTKANFLESV